MSIPSFSSQKSASSCNINIVFPKKRRFDPHLWRNRISTSSRLNRISEQTYLLTLLTLIISFQQGLFLLKNLSFILPSIDSTLILNSHPQLYPSLLFNQLYLCNKHHATNTTQQTPQSWPSTSIKPVNSSVSP